MYRLFKRLRVRFVECDLKQNEVMGKQPFTAWEIQRVAEVLGIPREQYGDFFFEPSPRTKAG